MKLFNDLHYLPTSHIVLPLCIILPLVSFCPSIILTPPPGNRLLIYAIYPCPISFCPLDSLCPPYHFAPWKSFNVHYFPIPLSFCPLSFCPISFCPPIICPPENGLIIYIIYPCPVSFCPLH